MNSILKNLPDHPEQLADLIEYQEGSVVSMSLTNSPCVTILLFALDEDDSISSEQYPGDTMYDVLDGHLSIAVQEAKYELGPGSCLKVAAGTSHALECHGRCKMLQITLNP